MHYPILLFLSFLIAGASAWHSESYGDQLNPADTLKAMECLQENYCSKYRLPKVSNIRCRVNDVVAYVCNYAGRGTKDSLGLDNMNPCSSFEMKEALADIARAGDKDFDHASPYMSGWWYENDWKKTYGFEKSCGHHECERHCGNNYNKWKRDVYFDFDMECTYSEKSGTKCQKVSGESIWDITPRDLPPPQNQDG